MRLLLVKFSPSRRIPNARTGVVQSPARTCLCTRSAFPATTASTVRSPTDDGWDSDYRRARSTRAPKLITVGPTFGRTLFMPKLVERAPWPRRRPGKLARERSRYESSTAHAANAAPAMERHLARLVVGEGEQGADHARARDYRRGSADEGLAARERAVVGLPERVERRGQHLEHPLVGHRALDLGKLGVGLRLRLGLGPRLGLRFRFRHRLDRNRLGLGLRLDRDELGLRHRLDRNRLGGGAPARGRV